MILKLLSFFGIAILFLLGTFILIYTLIYMVKEIIKLCRKWGYYGREKNVCKNYCW